MAGYRYLRSFHLLQYRLKNNTLEITVIRQEPIPTKLCKATIDYQQGIRHSTYVVNMYWTTPF